MCIRDSGGIAHRRVLRDPLRGLAQLLVPFASGPRAEYVPDDCSGDERQPVAHRSTLLRVAFFASNRFDHVRDRVPAPSRPSRRLPSPVPDHDDPRRRCCAPTRRFRRSLTGYRLAEHPPACANVCVAASARRPEPRPRVHSRHTAQSPVAQLAEQPAVNRQVTGSSPVGGARSPVAQLAEHSAVNRRVTGSSPVGGAERRGPLRGPFSYAVEPSRGRSASSRTGWSHDADPQGQQIV